MKIEVCNFEMLESGIKTLKKDIKLCRFCSGLSAFCIGYSGANILNGNKNMYFALTCNILAFAINLGLLIRKRRKLEEYTLIKDAVLEIEKILDGNEENKDNIVPFQKTK